MKLAKINEWGLIINSIADGTRPTTTLGTAVTPVQNATNGAYAQLIAGASVTQDVYAIDIVISNGGPGSAARDCLATLGFDPAGGTTYTDQADLLTGQSGSYGFGSLFHFPLFIKSGTSIGMRGSVNSATLTDFNALVRLYCRPSRPDLIYAGSYIEQFGVTVGSSTGTDITANMGTTNDGTWTQMGSAISSKGPLYAWEFGYGANDATMNAATIDVDISVGQAASKKIIIQNSAVTATNTELIGKRRSTAYAVGAVGELVYARAQSLNAADTNSIAVYGVGG